MAQAITTLTRPEVVTPRMRTPFMQVAWHIAGNPPALLGFVVIVAMVFTAIFAPVIAPYPYDKQNFDAVEQAPSFAHWLGTDQLGRDMFSRVVWGARSAVFVIIMVTLVSLSIGITLGAAAGYFGGWVETIIMRVADILFAFPGLLFIFFIAATIKPGILNWAREVGLNDLAKSGYLDYAVVIIALGTVGWAGLARLVRAQVLAVKEREFVIGARAIGVPTWKIIGRHVLPNSLAPVIVALSMGMGDIALSEGYLSFLGIGLQPPAPSWGNIIADNAGRYWRTFPQMVWLVLIPGAVLAAIVFAFNFLGDGLNEALNPEIERSK
ncbi:MAG: ABC transporter permease [Chloroflexi bacterium]|nr:ABC transporter permease [Chloroflexota bacterium]